MKPRVTIRQALALKDPSLGTALLGRAGAFWLRPAGSAVGQAPIDNSAIA